MNRIYRVIWNAAKRCRVAANEKTGSAQARGKAAAAAAVVIAAVSGSAAAGDAVITETGELQADKSDVVFYVEDVDNDGRFQYIGKKVEDVSKGSGTDVKISSVASNIKNVYAIDGTNLHFSGSDLDFTNVRFSALMGETDGEPGKFSKGALFIGSADESKTTGHFGQIDLNIGEDSISGQNDTILTIANADISIDTLRVADQQIPYSGSDTPTALISSDSMVSIDTLTLDRGEISNHGILNVTTLNTAFKEKDGRPSFEWGFLINDNQVKIGSATDANFIVKNAGTIEVTGDLNLTGGQTFVADGVLHGSENTGTIKVGGDFAVNGFNTFGNDGFFIGILTNNGTVSVAGDAALKGELINTGSTAKFEVTGDVTIDDVVESEGAQETIDKNGRSGQVHHIWNENGASFIAKRNLMITDDGIFENSADVDIAGDFTLEKGGMLLTTGTFDVAGQATISGNFRMEGGTASFTNVAFNPTDENSPIEEFHGHDILGGALMNVSGEMTTNGFGITDGEVKGGTNATLTIGDGEKAATVTINSAGKLTGFKEATLKSQSYLQNFGKAENSLSLEKLTIEQNAHLNTGTDLTDLTSTFIRDLTNNGEVAGLGGLFAGTLTNNGTIDVARAQIDHFTLNANTTAEFDSLILGDGTLDGKLTSDETEIHGLVTVGGSTGTSTLGATSIQGTLTAEDGNLSMSSLSFQEGGELVLKEMGSWRYEVGTLDATGGHISVTNGVLYVDTLKASDGLVLDINGKGYVQVENGWYENTTINLTNHDWKLTGEGGDGFGVNTVNVNSGSTVSYTDNAKLKNNTTLTISTGGTVEANKIAFEDRYTGGLTMAGGTLVTTLDQIFSSVSADDYIEGTNPSTGETVQIPLAGIQSVGAVKTELTGEHGIRYESGMFEFTDDGWTMNAVNSAADSLHAAFDKFEQSESTLVFSGSAQAEGGDFTLDDAADLSSGIVLSGTTVVNGDPESVSKLVLGSAGTEEGVFTLAQSVTGFQSVQGVDSVAVEEGHHLYLTGFGADGDSTALVVTAEGTAGSLTVEAGSTATLGSTNGSKAYGMLASVDADGTVEVAAGSDFRADSLSLGGTLTVGAGASLTLGAYADEAESVITNNGTLTIGGIEDVLTLNAETLNNGTMTVSGTEAKDLRALTTEAKFTNNGVLNATDLTANAEFTNTKDLKVGTLTAEADVFKNTGTVTINTGSFADLTNEGTISASDAVSLDHVVNRGTIKAGSLTVDTAVAGAVENGFTNEAGGVIDAETNDITITGISNLNAGTMKGGSAELTFELTDGGDEADRPELTNSGSMNYTASLAVSTEAGGEHTGKFFNKGTVESGDLSFSNVSLQNDGTVKAKNLTYEGALLNNNEKGVIEAETLAFESEGAVFTNKGTVTVTGTTGEDAAHNQAFYIGEGAKFVNEGTLDTTGIELGKDAAFEQAETGTVRTDALTVVGNSFELGSGTWIIENDKGIEFVDEDGEAVTTGLVMNITSGKEFATNDVSVAGKTYNVTKTLAFGTSAAGLAQKLAATDEGVAKADGVLVVGEAIKFGEDGIINLGKMSAEDDADEGAAAANAGIMMLAEGDGTGSTEAPSDKPAAETAFHAAANTVTVFTGDVFGEDGKTAAITGNGAEAVIESGALARLTNVSHEGEFKLISNFDFSQNLDAENNWTGGWTGEDVDYVVVDDGSDLDWNIDVVYDAEQNALVANATMADVRTKYDFAIADIANAALKNDAKGADVDFLRAVIRNDQLDIAQTEKVVNSVSQIAASLGTAANVLSDTSSLMDSVEGRMGFIGESGKGTGLWVQLEGGKYKTDGLKLEDGMDAGYDADTYGFTFGADTMVRPDLRIGAAFSYLKGDADAEGDVLRGTSDYDTFGIQAYAAWDLRDNVKLMGELGYFRSSADLKQTIAYADVRKATADVDTDAVTFGIRVEGKFDLGQVAVVPHAGLRGLWLMNDDFDTKIDGAKAFRNDQDDTFTMQLPIGVAFEKSFSTASGWTVTPLADITVTPQFGDTDYETTVTGIGTGVSQGVTADMAGDVTGRVLLGVKAGTQNVELGAHYGFTAGDAGRQDHSFGVNFLYRF